MLDRPYFMENEKWYYFDFNKKSFVLTKDAPKEAEKSYKEYVRLLNQNKQGTGGD